MPLHAIAAMSENRVIGANGKIPWHLADDFRWFKHRTMGGTLIMGRKTFDSIGRMLPGRKTVVLTRSPLSPGILCYRDIEELQENLRLLPEPHFVCGGAQIYKQLLPLCECLYLTRVKQVVNGDVLFPAFETDFTRNLTLFENELFRVERWTNNHETLSASSTAPEPWPLA